MQRVERRVEATIEPRARHGEEQARDRHREEAGQGQEVTAAFDRDRTGITEPPLQEHEHAREHEHGGDVERMERQPADETLGAERHRAELRDIDPVLLRVLTDALEVQQPQREWHGDEAGEDATPEHQLVTDPTRSRPPPDEPLRHEMGRRERRERQEVADAVAPERIPSTPVEHGGRRTPQPDGVPVDDAEGREDESEQVSDQCRVEPRELAATEEGDQHECGHGDQTPRDSGAVPGVASGMTRVAGRRRDDHVTVLEQRRREDQHRTTADTRRPGATSDPGPWHGPAVARHLDRRILGL